MIVVKCIGGLGNQLFQIAYALELSRKTGKSITVDLSAYETYKVRNFSVDKLLVSNYINIPKQSKNIIPKRVLYAQKTYRAIQKLIKMFVTKNNFEKHYIKLMSKLGLHFNFDNFYHDFDIETEEIYIYGYFQSELYFINSIESIREFFVSHNIDTLRNSDVGKDIAKTNSVAVSLRLGDDYLNSKDHFVCDKEYFTQAIKRFDQPEKRLFVFSDEENRARKLIDSIGISSADLVYVTGYSDIDSLMLMSMCKSFVLSNSSFSWWGAYLSISDNKRVIAPSKWYSYQDKPVDIYLKSMEII